MATSQQHARLAAEEAREASNLLQVSEGTPLSKDDLAGALRHLRNAAGQVVQALTAQVMEKREAGG